MGVETVDGFSGHADRAGLENFVETMNPVPSASSVSTVTSPRPTGASSALYQKFNMRTVAPKNLETFRLT